MVQGILEAKSRWEASGKPERSQARVQEIIERCCQHCEFLKPNDVCGVCGCSLVEHRTFLRVLVAGLALRLPGKLFMATEGCPLPSPKFTADV